MSAIENSRSFRISSLFLLSLSALVYSAHAAEPTTVVVSDGQAKAKVTASKASAPKAKKTKTGSAAGTLVFVDQTTSKKQSTSRAKSTRPAQRTRLNRTASRPASKANSQRSTNQTVQRTTKPAATEQAARVAPARVASNRIDRRVQPASSEQPVAKATEQPRKVAKVRKQQPKPVDSDPVAKMLVHAHQLSQTAATEKQFNEIAVICNTAEGLGAKGDQLMFALQLHSWAIKERDQIRVKQLESQLIAEKNEQQQRALEAEQQLRAEMAKQKLRVQQAEQKIEAEALAKKLRSERISQQRQTTLVQQRLRNEIAEQKLRAERAEQKLAQQRLEPIEPEPEVIDVFEMPMNDTFAEAPVALAPVAVAANSQRQVVTPTEPRGGNDWQALHDRAVTFAEQGKLAEALRSFNHVIELNPMFAKAYSNRATLHVQAGNLDLAIHDYKKACSLDNQMLHAHLGLGRAYHQLGKREAALKSLNQAIELDPENPELYCSRGDLLADMGSYRSALSDYAQTIDLDTEFAHAYRNGAWLLATCPDPRFRDPTNAIRGAQQALEFGYGQRHIALDTLAAALASDGQYEEAAKTMREVIEIAPSDARAMYESRLAGYEVEAPFFEQMPEDIAQAAYEVSDQ